MNRSLTVEDARLSLTDHLAAKGGEIFRTYGPSIGWDGLLRLLEDRSQVRYPCRLAFDAAQLNPGEFACPIPCGERPEDGFVMHIHPVFQSDLAAIPSLVLYQLVVVNYGAFASAQDAETFGAAALGMDREAYYETLCHLAERLDPVPAGTC